MTLELVNTLAALTTALVIAATAIVAIVQLRHLRSSNEINAQLAIRGLMNETRRDSDLVRNEIGHAMADPSFRRYVAAMGRAESCPHTPEQQAVYNGAFVVLTTGATIGELVRRGIITEDLLLAANHERIAATWRLLEGFVAIMRDAGAQPDLWDGWEYLAARAMQWGRLHPNRYPADTPRLHPKNPWADEDAKAMTL